MFGGQSRAYLAVEVPNGAKAIVYTVRSIMDYDPSNDIKLAASLTTLCTGNFAIAKTINALPVPNSNAVIDVFTIPTEDNHLNNFLAKKDDKWKFYTDQSCLSSLGCKRAIDVSEGTKKIYICLRNPSATRRIIAVVDVVAVMPD